MEKSKLDSVMKRSVAAAVMAPLTLLAVFAGMPYFNLFALFVGCLLAWEWAEMMPTEKKGRYTALYVFAVASSTWLLHLIAVPLAIVLATLAAVYKSRGEKYRGLLVLGVPYISIGVGAFAWLYSIGGMECVLWYILVIWSVDVGGYVVGCSLKGPKLAPKISPNKTWAGLAGAMVFALVVSWVFVFGFNIQPFWRKSLIIAAPFVALIAQTGDLIESAIKRKLGLKDSSNLIPGHGGIFDRIDGLIFAAPFVLIMVIVLFNVQAG